MHYNYVKRKKKGEATNRQGYPDFETRGNFSLWNPPSRALDFGISLKESGILLKWESGIHVPLTKKSGIHSLESRIQDCLGLPYMRRHQA